MCLPSCAPLTNDGTHTPLKQVLSCALRIGLDATYSWVWHAQGHHASTDVGIQGISVMPSQQAGNAHSALHCCHRAPSMGIPSRPVLSLSMPGPLDEEPFPLHRHSYPTRPSARPVTFSRCLLARDGVSASDAQLGTMNFQATQQMVQSAAHT